MINAQILDPFIDETLAAKGYEYVESEVKDALRDDLREQIEDFVMARTIAAFTKDEVARFETMLDERRSQKELRQFAMEHIPDYRTFLASALVEFQDVYLSSSN
jgi:hypothetical protein